MDRDSRRKTWQLNLILTAGIIATVLAGLILAQLDALQSRVLPERPGLPIVNIQATAIAAGRVIPLLIAPEPGELDQETAPVVVVPDDKNPRPEIITGVSEEGVIFTVCGEVPEGWLLYTVRPGDTLAALAAAVQSTEADLAAANCLTDPSLTAGMQLLVPREPAVTLCGPPQFWVRYQVQRGDTLGALVLSRRTTIEEILRANCRDTLDLVAGQLIFLPPGGYGSGSGSASAPPPSLTPLPTVALEPTLVASVTAIPQPPTQPPSLPTPLPTVILPTSVGPTATPPLVPTEIPPTSLPTNTPQPPPTNTPQPPPTNTPPPPPTNTPPPPPTNTPEPPPTNTPEPPPTEPPPPTDTPEPPPTEPPTEPAPTEPPPSP